MHAFTRHVYEHQAPRKLAVLEPLWVKFLPCEDHSEKNIQKNIQKKSALNFPHSPERGTHAVHWSMNHGIYIDASDFRLDVESNDTSYYGLAVGREVGLKYAGVNIKCVNVVMKLAESGKAGTKNRTV